MNARIQVARLPGGRLHLNDGPIDLVIGCDGDDECIRAACRAAIARFETVLDELCGELDLLRSELLPHGRLPRGTVARRMDAAVRPLCADRFITRMAAVAGAVADEIASAMRAAASLRRCYVNNGGDIALRLAEGETFEIGLVNRPDAPALFGAARISAADGIGGVATSGWRGRSFSLGIADAVTVLARDAAAADAAATVIANAVDLPGHPAVTRAPARSVDLQSDLGDRLVTRNVGRLSASDVERALGQGVDAAQSLADSKMIVACALHLAGQTRIVGALAPTFLATDRAPVAIPG